MSAYMYRLYAVQSFKGQKIGVYVSMGNTPDPQILSDAQDIVDGLKSRNEILKSDEWFYGKKEGYGGFGQVHREMLTQYTRMLKRSQKIINENENVDKAIFVCSTSKKTWRGENDLYQNNMFEEVKGDTPNYSACELIGTIKI